MGKQKFIAGTVYTLRMRFDIEWARDEEAPAYMSHATDLEAVLTNMDKEGYDLVPGGSGDGGLVFRLRGAPSAEAARRAREGASDDGEA